MIDPFQTKNSLPTLYQTVAVFMFKTHTHQIKLPFADAGRTFDCCVFALHIREQKELKRIKTIVVVLCCCVRGSIVTNNSLLYSKLLIILQEGCE